MTISTSIMLILAGNQQPTTIQPGVVTDYTYYVTIQCLDPNGGTATNNKDLRRIIDDLPDRNAASGDYLQYITGSTSWDQTDWGVPPFNPTTISEPTGQATVLYHQHLEWNFRTAGYSDIRFHLRPNQDDDLQGAGRPGYRRLRQYGRRRPQFLLFARHNIPRSSPVHRRHPIGTGVPGALLTVTKTGRSAYHLCQATDQCYLYYRY